MKDNNKLRCQELSDFLKTRRFKITPEQAGLPPTGRRRTSGLRREEVAALAGIGVTWYTWLEQGRPIQVSQSVVESLARTLQLSPDEKKHLYTLTNQPVPIQKVHENQTVASQLQHLLNHLALCPSLITDIRWNVLAWNNEADLLFGPFEEMSHRERNIVWAMFMNTYYRSLFTDWEKYARDLLAAFRMTCTEYIGDTFLQELSQDLINGSDEFKQWWSLHELENSSSKYKQLRHPEVGLLDFEVTTFIPAGYDGIQMVVHVPISETHEHMKHLLRKSAE